MMRLWLIERGGDGYDQYFGFVVRAESEVGARRIAAARHDSDLPVLVGESFDAAEFADVVRHQSRAVRYRDSRDKQVIRPDQQTQPCQTRPDAAVLRGACIESGGGSRGPALHARGGVASHVQGPGREVLHARLLSHLWVEYAAHG